MTATLAAASPPSLLRLAGAVALVAAASALGGFATAQALVDWYPALVKPSFTPPNAAFPIAWTLLYALMAFAFWRILRLPAETPGRDRAIALFCVQLALNVAWSFAFFFARSPGLGVVVVLALEAAILATMLAFWRLDRAAGAVLVPYALWVAFASLLTIAIWRLN